jgi:hypothetical protein
MRTLLIGALAATLAGCSSCPLPPQAGMRSCTDTNGFACFDRTAARQSNAPKPVSFKANSAPLEIKPAIAAKTEKPSSAHARDKAHLATKTEKPTTIAAKGEPPPSPIPLPPRSLQPATGAAADSDTSKHSGIACHRRCSSESHYQNDTGAGGGRYGCRGANDGRHFDLGAGTE